MALTGIVAGGAGGLACESGAKNSFEIVKTPAARIVEATAIIRVRIAETGPLKFDQTNGEQGVCGYHGKAENLRILDGPPNIDTNFISNTPLVAGEEYVAAILDMRGKLPEIKEHPYVSGDDRNFAKCRDKYQQYSLGAARLVVADGLELIDVESSDLLPTSVQENARQGRVPLSLLRETILRIRAEAQPGAPLDP